MTPTKRSDNVLEMSNVSIESQATPKFNAEAFAMNIARAMESSGQALAAYFAKGLPGSGKDVAGKVSQPAVVS